MDAIFRLKRRENSVLSTWSLYLVIIFACGMGWMLGVVTSNASRELLLYSYPSDYTIAKSMRDINQQHNNTVRSNYDSKTRSSTTSDQRPQNFRKSIQSNQNPQQQTQTTNKSLGSATEHDSQKPPASIRKKPYFVLHVGPQKTGTSSLQKSFFAMAQNGMFERDNWHYTSFFHAFPDGQNLTNRLFTIPFESPNFWDMFEAEVAQLRASRKNILLSKEGYSVMFDTYAHYKKLRNILANDWEVLIVVGYRPYYEWVISYWWQFNNRNKFRYKDDRTWLWKEEGDYIRKVKPMIPDFYQWVSSIRHYTDWSVELAKPYFNVTILNMYDEKGMRTKFLCDILNGTAPAACQESIRIDQSNKTEEILNQKTLYKIHFDALALEAASRGMVDISQFPRMDVFEAVMGHVEGRRNSSTPIETVSDLPFPMICPNRTVLQALLDRTLELELRYFPELLDRDPRRRSKLESDFWKTAAEKTFCHIDMYATLSQDDWQQFFRKFRTMTGTNQ